MAWNWREEKVYILTPPEVSGLSMFSYVINQKYRLISFHIRKPKGFPPHLTFLGVLCLYLPTIELGFFELKMNVQGLCFLTISEVSAFSRLLSRR